MPSKRAAVLGSPIAHSLSPVLHNAAYQALGLDDWQYEAIETDTRNLWRRIKALDETWAGYSVTMPLKYAVVRYLDRMDDVARATGAVNTVVRAADGTLDGYNSDVFGLVTALQEAGVESPERAVVLGAGGTAVSALAALEQMGVKQPLVLVRNLGTTREAAAAAARLGLNADFQKLPLDEMAAALQGADVVISTTPKHAMDSLAKELRGHGAGVELGTLLDVVYDPRPTALSKAWAAEGGTVVGGERMLLHQATWQVELMTGQPAPVAAMDAALQEAL